MIQKLLRAALLSPAVALAFAACDDGVKPPSPPSLSITPESRSLRVGETFQVRANLLDESGDLTQSSISWTSSDGSVASVTGSGEVTGVRPGETRIIAEVPGAADTMQVQVVQTPAEIEIAPIPELKAGDVVQLQATVTDTDGELMDATITWRAEPRSLAVIDSVGQLTALGVGPVLITATAAPVSATVQATIEPAPPPPGCDAASVSLSVGETIEYDGGMPLNLCLAGEARYTLVMANAAAGALRTDLAGADLAEVAPGITPNRLPLRSGLRSSAPALQPDREFERRLRRSEREELSFSAARGRGISRSLSISPSASAVGDVIELSTSTTCTDHRVTGGRVEFMGERSIVVADTANPDGMTGADYARFGALFDTLLYEVVTDYFGEPAGLNGENKITIFFTRAVNELTEEDSDGYVGGYFWAGDLFPRVSTPGMGGCASSNEREMFYMLAADPEGTINGNRRSVDFVLDASASTIAHELEHLINASRRLYVNDAEDFETTWLDEGLAHIAEEVVFYHQSGFGPREDLDIDDLRTSQQTVDATNDYAMSNLLRLDSFLRDVERQGPFQLDDDLETRGAIWQFLRYALDRHSDDDRTVLRALVDSRTTGMPNLTAALGVDPAEWFVDDAVAVYADDAVTGLADRFQHRSWDFRSILGWINDDGFVVESRTLGDGGALSVGLEGWGTGYVRFGVGAGRVGSVRVGTPAEPPPANLRMVLLRTH